MRTLLILLCLMMTPSAAWAGEGGAEKAPDSQTDALPKIDMTPFKFSLIKRGRVRGKVSVTLTLVVNKSDDMKYIRLHQPQLRSDFLTALTILANQQIDPNRPIDPDIISAYLTPYADYRLGTGKVTVYVKEAMVTPE
ncbi:hypothetical protein [Kordiimonas marina]|uniref:hypothetical protein n=1 Tax=Kordiimonas marina TaxID=2872312 RepID=UPI001FF12817|nr:hypothetical protein [Kordiimonas marina]MCJ9428086.1 hypothetical protein [Kordiimonas marina]